MLSILRTERHTLSSSSFSYIGTYDCVTAYSAGYWALYAMPCCCCHCCCCIALRGSWAGVLLLLFCVCERVGWVVCWVPAMHNFIIIKYSIYKKKNSIHTMISVSRSFIRREKNLSMKNGNATTTTTTTKAPFTIFCVAGTWHVCVWFLWVPFSIHRIPIDVNCVHSIVSFAFGSMHFKCSRSACARALAELGHFIHQPLIILLYFLSTFKRSPCTKCNAARERAQINDLIKSGRSEMQLHRLPAVRAHTFAAHWLVIWFIALQSWMDSIQYQC